MSITALHNSESLYATHQMYANSIEDDSDDMDEMLETEESDDTEVENESYEGGTLGTMVDVLA